MKDEREDLEIRDRRERREKRDRATSLKVTTSCGIGRMRASRSALVVTRSYGLATHSCTRSVTDTCRNKILEMLVPVSASSVLCRFCSVARSRTPANTPQEMITRYGLLERTVNLWSRSRIAPSSRSYLAVWCAKLPPRISSFTVKISRNPTVLEDGTVSGSATVLWRRPVYHRQAHVWNDSVRNLSLNVKVVVEPASSSQQNTVSG